MLKWFSIITLLVFLRLSVQWGAACEQLAGLEFAVSREFRGVGSRLFCLRPNLYDV